ncbi:PREDICTED: uncharacterized protein LOC106126064 [Papilio xuthus]|uniref:Uncharacterized protein LOC106126064 n=1 Tax=Papilio xuthus TaxID=66420 RepID=A0AAJ6ZTK9_PAPXU|nr:PREDICTED: uncharacterized protein LOC106126064 [Papilio xuthus]
MELLVKNRLEWLLENRNILSNTQFGFRRGKGCLDSLSILTSEIRIAFTKNENVLGVFLDISSAYDSVSLPLLRQKMLQLSIPERLINFICSLLMSRSISVRHCNTLLPSRSVWKGLPQGSVLSPLLYNIYTFDLDCSVNQFCKILQYADDIALYSTSPSINVATICINTALHHLNEYLLSHNLSLSITKCSAVLFSRKRNVPSVAVRVNNTPINRYDSVKFLGVTLDSKLSGRQHLEHVIKKCEKGVNILRALTGVRWGSHPATLKLLYDAVIRSHFDYGGFLLDPCKKIALSKLDKIQSRCLRLITGAMRCSPVNALQVECLDPPLYLRRQFLSDRFFCGVVQIKSHPLLRLLKTLSQTIPTANYWSHKDPPLLINSFNKYTSHSSPIEQSVLFPIYETQFDALIFCPRIILNFGVDKDSPGANLKFNSILESDWPQWNTIYTDASKSSPDSSVGSAVWIPKFKIILSFKCPPSTSIFTGEAIALLEAISFVESHKLNQTLIFSDSLSCLTDILKTPFRARDNSSVTLKIKQLLYKCHCSDIEVILAWIPSHTGISGNETVDSCAKVAVHSGCDTYKFSLPRDLRISAKSSMLFNWNNTWQRSNQSKGKYYGSIQPSLPSKPWYLKHGQISKSTISVICRLRLGFIATPVFLAKIRIRNHSLCECGLEEGSLEHIFFNCPKLKVHLYDLLPTNIPRPINIPFLLTMVHTPLSRNRHHQPVICQIDLYSVYLSVLCYLIF